MDPMEWARAYALKRTNEEKVGNRETIIKYQDYKLIDKGIRRSCNAGYLFLQDIYYSLGLDKICDSISKKLKLRT